MGEMADMAISDSLDDWELYSDWARGKVSTETAFDAGIIDELGYEIWSTQMPERAKTCKHCGKPGLYWKKVGSMWRLHDEKGAAHECMAHPSKKIKVTP
jgi:hypothetical protein